MKNFLVSLVVAFLVQNAFGQEDNVGSGHALSFNGITDYVDLGNRYDNISLPITVSAWINLSSSVTNWAPIFISQDNAGVYNGFWLIVQPNMISLGYGDGMGENLPDFRRSKTATVNNISERWVHITGVIRDKQDMDIYVNGVNVGGNYSGYSNLPMSSSPTDIVKIGKWFSNDVTFYFKGKMDEIRLWNRSLTENDVKQFMCKKISTSETGLIGNWSLNETSGNVVTDRSESKYNGSLIGCQRLYSGAPIGDTSVHMYSSQWSQKSLSLMFNEDSFLIDNVRGNPRGVHIYAVKDAPSQTNGLPDCSSLYYFGVFVDGDGTSGQYDMHYQANSSGANAFSIYKRSANNVALWDYRSETPTQNKFSVIDQVYRGEFIRTKGLTVDLGEDIFSCDNGELILQASVDDPSFAYSWSTGATSPSITVTESGDYSLKVKSQCGDSEDLVHVELAKPPPSFELIANHPNFCSANEITIKPSIDVTSFLVTWNDGSHERSLIAKRSETYSLSLENSCGTTTASITIPNVVLDSVFVPNVFTPNGDELNDRFEIDPRIKENILLQVFNRWGKEVFYSRNYNNDWNGGNLPSGIYYYYLVGECMGEKKGSVSILR